VYLKLYGKVVSETNSASASVLELIVHCYIVTSAIYQLSKLVIRVIIGVCKFIVLVARYIGKFMLLVQASAIWTKISLVRLLHPLRSRPQAVVRQKPVPHYHVPWDGVAMFFAPDGLTTYELRSFGKYVSCTCPNFKEDKRCVHVNLSTVYDLKDLRPPGKKLP